MHLGTSLPHCQRARPGARPSPSGSKTSSRLSPIQRVDSTSRPSKSKALRRTSVQQEGRRRHLNRLQTPNPSQKSPICSIHRHRHGLCLLDPSNPHLALPLPRSLLANRLHRDLLGKYLLWTPRHSNSLRDTAVMVLPISRGVTMHQRTHLTPLRFLRSRRLTHWP